MALDRTWLAEAKIILRTLLKSFTHKESPSLCQSQLWFAGKTRMTSSQPIVLSCKMKTNTGTWNVISVPDPHCTFLLLGLYRLSFQSMPQVHIFGGTALRENFSAGLPRVREKSGKTDFCKKSGTSQGIWLLVRGNFENDKKVKGNFWKPPKSQGLFCQWSPEIKEKT